METPPAESEEREKLLRYREQVVVELTRRAERTRKLDQEIAAKQLLLEGLVRHPAVIAGDTVKTMGQAAYRSKLERTLRALGAERKEAAEELARAEQRLSDVDIELSELEATEAEEE